MDQILKIPMRPHLVKYLVANHADDDGIYRASKRDAGLGVYICNMVKQKRYPGPVITRINCHHFTVHLPFRYSERNGVLITTEDARHFGLFADALMKQEFMVAVEYGMMYKGIGLHRCIYDFLWKYDIEPGELSHNALKMHYYRFARDRQISEHTAA